MKKLFAILFSLFTLGATVFAQTSTYTVSEVAKHNTESDCWMIFDVNVYDLTDYIASHDRYMDIRTWCGKDMTKDFETKDGSGRDHKSSTYSLLENYLIGTISKEVASTAAPATTISDTVNVTQTIEEHAEDDEYSVEIEGQEMKTKTINEIAELWAINANDLLALIIKEFDLKGSYTTVTVLEDMRDEYKFSPAQIKDIAEGLKNGTLSNTTESATSETKSKLSANPYNLAIPLFGTIIVYLIHYKLAKSKFGLKNRFLSYTTFNMFWNSVMLITLIPAFGFGLFMILRYSIRDLYDIDFDFMWWHVEGSIVMGTAAVLHLMTRLRQYFAQIRFTGTKPVVK